MSADGPDLIAALWHAYDGAPAPDTATIVVAHPDDETIGIGGHLGHLPGATVVHITDGAPHAMRDAHDNGFADRAGYAAARRAELAAALAEAQVPPERTLTLGIADQRAAHELPDLARALADALRKSGARIVFTHPYEGGHPDHDATSFAVHAACRLLRQSGEPAPAIAEMAFYHLGRDGPVLQRFAPGPAEAEVAVGLDGPDWDRKRRMLACHATQRRTLAPFTSRTERFRRAPDYDFRRLPNGGALYYAGFAWGLTGAEWVDKAGAALDALGLP